jgi:hypothetical protein
MKTLIPCLFIIYLLTLTVCLCSAERDVSVEQIIDNYRQHYEDSIANIDDYTAKTDQMTTYYKKYYDNGRPFFKTKTVYASDDMPNVTEAASIESDLFSPELYDSLRENAVYEGTADVDGYTTHVIYTEDMDDHVIVHKEDEDSINYARIYIDAEKWIIRKLEFEVETRDQDQLLTLHPSITMEDYHDIEGLLIPYRTVVVIEGLGQNLSEEERQEALTGLAEMERMLAQMSGEEKERMEKMMGSSFEAYKNMLESETLEISLIINEVEVNTGLTDEFFEE